MKSANIRRTIGGGVDINLIFLCKADFMTNFKFPTS